MKIALVGCGYVAEFYGTSLANYPQLKLVGAFDKDARNLDAFLRRHPGRKYASLEELAGDAEVELVLNLTDPRSHFSITRQCLEAGKHVYSEKPLAMTAEEAKLLLDQAASRKLYLASAPCSVLSETAQTAWKAIRERAIGRVRLVYANLDDGMIAPNLAPWQWRNESGVHWPAKDEFEIGCTYEHAGYLLSWLAAFFGPALRVTSFASCQLPDKGIAVDRMAPDFTVGCIEYADGVVARVTCGLVAPNDRSLTVVGDDGVLFVGDVRNDAGPVMIRSARPGRWQSRVERYTRPLQRWLEARYAWPGAAALFQRRYPLLREARGRMAGPDKPVDFMRGPAELAEAIRERRPARLSAELGVHMVEIIEALQYPERFNHRRELKTTFAPMQPLAWAS